MKTKIKLTENPIEDGGEIFIAPQEFNHAAIALIYQNNSTIKDKDEARKYAARIVKCWNEHNNLVEALKEIHKLYGGREEDGYLEPYKSAWSKVESALKQAE